MVGAKGFEPPTSRSRIKGDKGFLLAAQSSLMRIQRIRSCLSRMTTVASFNVISALCLVGHGLTLVLPLLELKFGNRFRVHFVGAIGQS